MGKRGTWVIAAVIPKYLSPRLLGPVPMTILFLLYHKTDTYVFEKLIYIIREAEI